MTDQMRDTDRRDNAQDAQDAARPGHRARRPALRGRPGRATVDRLPAELDVHGAETAGHRRQGRATRRAPGRGPVRPRRARHPGFFVAYLAIKLRRVRRQRRTRRSCRRSCSASCLGLALFCIGAGVIHWAKTLMPDDEIVQERQPLRSSAEERRGGRRQLARGRRESAGFVAQLICGAPAGGDGAAPAARGGPAARPRPAAAAPRCASTLWTEGQRIRHRRQPPPDPARPTSRSAA